MRRHHRTGHRMGQHREHARSAASVEQMETLHQAMDSNSDGVLSKEEFSELDNVRASLRQDHMFTRMDQNEDGVLTPDEFPPRYSRLQKLDTDGDGEISDEEKQTFHQKHHERG